jgi:hypothetical protein
VILRGGGESEHHLNVIQKLSISNNAMLCETDRGDRLKARRNPSMAEIGKPEKRRVLVPDETPAPTPQVVPERKSPAKVPEREPA